MTLTEYRLRQALDQYRRDNHALADSRAELHDAIGEVIREGWSQAEVGRFMDVSRQYVNDVLHKLSEG